MAGADIKLLFGVLGEGSLSGESGQLIQSQLTELMKELNKNPLKVKVGIDTDTGGKKSWSGQLQEKLNQISQSGKFSVQISNLKLSAGAISDFKKQLGAIVNTLGLSTGTEITISSKGIGEIKKDLQDAGAAATDAARKIAEFKVQMEALGGQKNSIKKSIDDLAKTATSDDERARIAEITAQYEQWAVKIEEIRASKATVSGEYRAEIEAEGAAIRTNIDSLNQARAATEEATRASEDAANAQRDVGQAAENAAKREAEAANKAAAAATTQNNLYKQINTTLMQVRDAQRNWTAASTGKTKADYAALNDYINRLENLKNTYDTLTPSKVRETLSEITSEFKNSSEAIRAAGENTKTFSQKIGTLAQKFGTWFSITRVMMAAVRSVRQMVKATIELDDAMTQLKIVTRTTEEAYNSYMESISKTATRVGSSITDLISSTTTYARLGYSLDESSALAEFTAMLQNVGDIDVADAQDALTAIVKAFGISVDEIESIMDKLVITGNNFPISVSQIAEGMNNASSALAAAGNTFDQSVALLTAANTTIQNAAKSSTGLRTIAARLRSTKTELDELGETMTDAEYGNLVAALTKYNVALTDATGEFRSTYDIVADIAAIWDDLSTMEQAALANAIAGVRQQSVFYSMVEQFQEASGAMEDMANSAGTLQDSYSVFMESTTAHINQFKAAFQSLSQTTFSSDFLNDFIDFGTTLLGILESIVKVVNALGGLNTVLYVTVGLIATINAESLYHSITKIVGNIGKFSSDILGFFQIFRDGFKTAQAAGAGLFGSLKAGFTSVSALASTAQLAVGAFVAVLGIALIAYSKYKQSVEETRQRNIDAANSASELTNELSDLTGQYIELTEAVKNDDSAKDDLLSTQDKLIEKLGLEKDEVSKLTEEYGNLDDAIKSATVSSLQDAERDLRGGLNEFEEDLLKAGKPSMGGSLNNISGLLRNGLTHTSDVTRQEQIRGYKALKALEDAGYISSSSYSSYTDNNTKYSQGFAMYLGDEEDLKTVEGIIEAYDRLGEMLDIVSDKAGSDNFVYDALYDKYNNITDVLGDYKDSISALNKNLAEQYMLQGLIGREIPTTQEEYDAYRDSVVNAASSSGEFIGTTSDIEAAIDYVLAKQTQFSAFQRSSAEQVENTTGRYKASLSNLADTLTELKSKYDLLETANQEMASGDGLSASTIKALADAEEHYLDFLYEENGIVKLNTEAWEENARAKMKGEISDIQKEIDSLEERNKVLAETLETYKTNKYMNPGDTSMMDAWDKKIQEVTDEINVNTEAIAANQSKLDLYNALYGNITGDLDAYSAALANFSNVASTVDSISSSFQTLADLQSEVANGFAMSLDKALEFASVYPEILNNAQVSADGQILLNEDVVNSFLQGKKAELDAQIDTQIAQLEADKAVLEAKMEAAQAQLDLAKNVGEGEGQIAKELAEYRINAGNAVAQAMIDAGIDEATAFKLAAAAMAQNAEEFDRVAMEVCTDVNGNFNQAAYDLAQTMYNNLTNVKTDLASVARQAHETAKAIAGVADGSVSGSSTVQGGSGGGTGSSGIKLNLTSGSFKGTEYTYTAKESGLEDFISEIELDISNYKDAIAQIDGQIAVLQSLKNLPLKSFKSNKSGSGGSGSGDSAAKDVEEYVAAIEDYREAIERLNRIQIRRSELELELSNTDDLREQIRLQSELVDVYKAEQDALHNLNDLRDETIAAGADTLRQLGFSVEYDRDKNKFFVENLEHLNELVADSKGEYGSVQEATNALRQETEELINTLDSLNEQNQENSESWMGLRNSIREAKIAIIDNLKQIVTDASDAVDEIQNVYDTLKAAADEYAENGGFISVDAFQDIIALGPQYMQYLRDENGLLVINEENINKVIIAKTRQLAAEQALTYVERLRLALEEGSIENLNTLLYATTDATDATFGLAYAQLELMHAMGDLDDQQYAAALHNIQSIESLANTAIASVGQVAGESSEKMREELENMKSGVDDILKYVMDMLKHRIQQQIDALEDLKDAYGDIIDLRKEALDAAKQEADYEDEVAEKVKEIAKLQERINALSLDDSRDAQAQKIKLEEEMAELQKELSDDQNDYAVDAQKEALDDMKEAYEDEKDAEIAALEETISSYQKLYDMAIDYIENHWNTLYDELITWNTEYGSVLNSEITEAWNNCLAAAQRYGSYVSALNSIDADIEAAGSGGSSKGPGNNTVVGNSNHSTSTKEDSIHAIIKEMYSNSQEHHTASKERKAWLDNRNLQLGTMLAQYGVNTHRDNGTWYMDGSKQLLYDKYKRYIYHRGGIAGDNPTLKQNEIMAVLEKGEAVLDEQKERGLYRLVEFATTLSDKFSELIRSSGLSNALTGPGGVADVKPDAPPNVTSSEKVSIEFGDTIIYGANEDTVEQHRAITRQQANELLEKLNIKR